MRALKASIQPAATKVTNMLYLSSRGRLLCLRQISIYPVTLFRLLPLTLEHPLVRIQLLPYRDGRFLPENKHNIQHLQVSFFLSGKTFQLRFQYRIILLRILL